MIQFQSFDLSQLLHLHSFAFNAADKQTFVHYLHTPSVIGGQLQRRDRFNSGERDQNEHLFECLSEQQIDR